jgi:hypothetical protein
VNAVHIIIVASEMVDAAARFQIPAQQCPDVVVPTQQRGAVIDGGQAVCRVPLILVRRSDGPYALQRGQIPEFQ